MFVINIPHHHNIFSNTITSFCMHPSQVLSCLSVCNFSCVASTIQTTKFLINYPQDLHHLFLTPHLATVLKKKKKKRELRRYYLSPLCSGVNPLPFPQEGQLLSPNPWQSKHLQI